MFFTTTVYAESSEQETAGYFMEYVGRFMERRTRPLVNDSAREIVPLVVDPANSVSRFEHESIGESQGIFATEVEAVEELSNWRDYFVLAWGGYSCFDIGLTLLKYDIGTDKAVLLVREFTKLYFAEDLGPNLDYTAWQYNRVFTFERDGSGWALVSLTLIKESPFSPLNEPTGATREEIMDGLHRKTFKPIFQPGFFTRGLCT